MHLRLCSSEWHVSKVTLEIYFLFSCFFSNIRILKVKKYNSFGRKKISRATYAQSLFKVKTRSERLAITQLFLNESEIFNFCKDLLDRHFMYGYLGAENLAPA